MHLLSSLINKIIKIPQERLFLSWGRNDGFSDQLKSVKVQFSIAK